MDYGENKDKDAEKKELYSRIDSKYITSLYYFAHPHKKPKQTTTITKTE